MSDTFGHRHHHQDDPWRDAPVWARELGAMLLYVIDKQRVDRNAIIAAIGTQIPPDQLKSLTAQMKAADDALAASVAANQPTT